MTRNGRQTRWARILEEDAKKQSESYPNPLGGFWNLLYPYRLYIVVAAAVAIPILIVISLLD